MALTCGINYYTDKTDTNEKYKLLLNERLVYHRYLSLTENRANSLFYPTNGADDRLCCLARSSLGRRVNVIAYQMV